MAHKVQRIPDEVELETIALAELSRLKRQYRIMENDRDACSKDARLQLHNQRNMIDRLEYEKAELVIRIKTATSKTFARKDKEMEEKLKCTLTMQTKYDEMIRTEKQEIAELDNEICKLSKEIATLKTKITSDIQLRDIALRQDKMIHILENRLEVATKRFNIAVAQNTKLRNEIEDMLKERTQFTALWNKLINQLNTGKQIINDLIEQATIAFNQRDEELNKIQALRERGLRDLKTHVSEMCELQRTMDNEMKLQEFLGVKGQYREMADLNAKQSLQSRMDQLTRAIQDAHIMNELTNREQAETLEKLKRELEDQTALADAAEENLIQCDDVIEKLLKGIDSLFKAIRCDNSPILQLLGDHEQITTSNVMLYLGIIEKRITQMFHKVYWLDKATRTQQLRLDEERKPRLKVPQVEQIASTQPCALQPLNQYRCVEKEKLQIVSEGLEQPLTRDEATKKLKQRLEEDYSELLHNISGCHLPAARKIIQKRYQ
ncbi:unnamed protein product [Heterotrigona itama]|uniref:ODAD1 central coiled coil region domain-containing protein n=1 Tax=Heterotrigona itama TaxID=395501 RepID=A0A6V7HGH0_9HYME|nr:unnamed protein product [Heterotrigona itama]